MQCVYFSPEVHDPAYVKLYICDKLKRKKNNNINNKRKRGEVKLQEQLTEYKLTGDEGLPCKGACTLTLDNTAPRDNFVTSSLCQIDSSPFFANMTHIYIYFFYHSLFLPFFLFQPSIFLPLYSF